MLWCPFWINVTWGFCHGSDGTFRTRPKDLCIKLTSWCRLCSAKCLPKPLFHLAGTISELEDLQILSCKLHIRRSKVIQIRIFEGPRWWFRFQGPWYWFRWRCRGLAKTKVTPWCPPCSGSIGPLIPRSPSMPRAPANGTVLVCFVPFRFYFFRSILCRLDWAVFFQVRNDSYQYLWYGALERALPFSRYLWPGNVEIWYLLKGIFGFTKIYGKGDELYTFDTFICKFAQYMSLAWKS